ncbi:MAG: esterase family protein [Bacteriovoracaceae bacterium]|nr:esterase family protein [Bacteriovoracaceae bacterium]
MIEWLTFSSKALKGFPMGDPHERVFPVYLPPGYSRKRAEPYPVVFLLAGWSGRSSSYVNDSSVFQIPLQARLDQAIRGKKMPPVIVVFPDGASKLGGSQYVNSPAIGNYMDYIADELVELIDDRYHTHRSARYRGIAGHSSGGYGALVHGFLRPDRFQFVCSSAGDTYFELSFAPAIIDALNEIKKAGSIQKFISEISNSTQPPSGRKMNGLLMVSMAPIYAPNLKAAPLYGDLPFDLETGEMIEEVWKKYLKWDPVHLIDKTFKKAKALKFIHLDAGLQDEYALQWGHRQLAAKLKKYKIPHQLDEFVGTHSGNHWRFEGRIQLMLTKMFSMK